MNTILLQKILDILTEGLAHVGDFFKDLFVSDPQDGQVIGYDAEEGKWKNIDLAELNLEFTHTAGPADPVTISNAGADMPVKSLIVNIEPSLFGTDSIIITHTYGDNETETKTVNLPSTLHGGELDIISGQGVKTFDVVDMGSLNWSYSTVYKWFYAYGLDIIPSTLNIIPPSNYEVKTVAELSGDLTIDDAITVNGTSVVVRNLDYTDAAAFKTAMSGVMLGYPLATPTSLNTTPIQINTQGGSESFATSAGDIEMEYYTATAGTIKDLVTITDDITSEVTKNTTDFSDILLKVSQNNKVVSVEIYSATTAAAVNDTFLSNLPKPAMNCPVMVINKTVGEEGIFYGSLSTSGNLNITVPGAKSFGGLITYVAK